MKRDMKLVFDVLVFIELTDTDIGPTYFEIIQEIGTKRGVWDSGDAEEELNTCIVHHLDILVGGGLLSKYEQEPTREQSDETFYQLTWQGHDLLDAMRKVVDIR
ncbi:DUF2513 domain-containing protein [Pseudomonas piscis]|uniref:DUF2513 domain-containing protein n=1 Tax=Pseudomonas piscis TaxID=2614538 RepID=A0A7X1PMU9_9PSED|nr:DUF2513 domain-containing protein [Pseudomonas piscis]MQA53718.1 DUF2513 domain-containing protein [Pseudomonas piscis]